MDDALLATYLRDHLAGATAGRALARRAADAERYGPYGSALAAIAGEIDADRDALLRVMRTLAVRPDPLKVVAGWTAERVARLKANRRLFRRSPLSRVDEIEGLVLGVRGKRALWTALRTIAPTAPEIARAADLNALAERADDQLSRLEDLRLQAFQSAILQGAYDRG